MYACYRYYRLDYSCYLWMFLRQFLGDLTHYTNKEWLVLVHVDPSFLFIHFSRQQECTALSTMKIISKKNLFGFFQNGTEHIFSTVGTKDFSSIALHHSLYINLSFPLIIEESRISVNVSIYSSTSNQNKSCI